MRLVESKPSHWYRTDGSPCHELPKKSGNGMKAVTLREARELGLLPSVTSILRILAKPELENWKIEQAIHAALTLPRLPDEGEDAYARRVVEDMDAQVEKAADFGSRLHAAIAADLADPHCEHDPALEPYLKHFRDWAAAEIEEVHAVENVIVNLEYGYAGRLDLYATLRGIGVAVIDFKTQRVRNGKPTFYDEWPLQLAAYAFAQFAGRQIEVPTMVSIVIDSQQPGPIFCQQWSNGYEYFKQFQHALELWKHLKKYNPSVAPANQNGGLTSLN